jgi:hypothetical protein
MAFDGPYVSPKSRTTSESESLKTTESSNKRLALARERVSGLDELAERTTQRLHAMLQYVREFQRYCRPVESLDDFKLAPYAGCKESSRYERIFDLICGEFRRNDYVSKLCLCHGGQTSNQRFWIDSGLCRLA